MVSIGIKGNEDGDFEDALSINVSCIVIVFKFNVIKDPVSLLLHISSIDFGDPEHANNDSTGEQLI
jgi:hypothetical protein